MPRKALYIFTGIENIVERFSLNANLFTLKSEYTQLSLTARF
jgi:hypothetical protein